MIPIVRVTMWSMNRPKDSMEVELIAQRAQTDPEGTEEEEEEFVKCGIVDDFYHLKEEIGRGAYGTVKKCMHKENGNIFAAKIIKTSNHSIRKDVLREIDMMRKLAHHNKIVALYDAFQSPFVITMVMEYVPGGELFELIVKEEFLMEDEAIDYVRQILEALQFMHRKNIVHLDLKPENILCVSQNESRDIKLVDFGLARDLKAGNEVKSSFGTPDFVAPEVIRMKPISTSSDMWSLGVLTYVLLSGLMPFSGEDDHHTLVKVAKADWDFDDDCFDDLSEDARDFIEGLLEKEPGERYTVDECLRHPWLTNKKVVLLKINTKKHKAWMAKRMWKKSINALVAVRRMSLSPSASKARRRSMDSAIAASVPKESEEEEVSKELNIEISDRNNSVQPFEMTPPLTRTRRSYTESEGSPKTVGRKTSLQNMQNVAKETFKLARNIHQTVTTEGGSAHVPSAGLNGLTPPILKFEDEPLINSLNMRDKVRSNSNEMSSDSICDDKNNNIHLTASEDANEIERNSTKVSVVVEDVSTSRVFDPVAFKINKDEISNMELEIDTETSTSQQPSKANNGENESRNGSRHPEPSQEQSQNTENSSTKNESICIHSTRTKVSQNCFLVPQKITVQLDRCSSNGSTPRGSQVSFSAGSSEQGINSPTICVSMSQEREQSLTNGITESTSGQENSCKTQDTELAPKVQVRCKMGDGEDWEQNEEMKSGKVITVKLDAYSNLELPADQAWSAHLRRASTGSPAISFRESTFYESDVISPKE